MNCLARIRRQTSYVLHDDFTQAVFYGSVEDAEDCIRDKDGTG